MYVLAETRGGKCLSINYKNDRSKLDWECGFGHTWAAEPRAIRSGQWCPICSSGLGERICRLVFEEVFGEIFIKCRPEWLISDKTDSRLELDGFCTKLNIAFEYNGAQHYKDIIIYKQSTSDARKVELCIKNNIKLFVVPQPNRIPTIEYVKEIIKIQSKELEISLPDCFDNLVIDTKRAYTSSYDTEELCKVKNKAISMGGKCLSDIYLGCHTPLTFQCGDCNYIWNAAPRDINAGSWCHKCAGRAYTITDAIKLANLKNGKCLSVKFEKSTSKMLWECEVKHTWTTSFSQIKRGSWCPLCFRLKQKLNSKGKLS